MSVTFTQKDIGVFAIDGFAPRMEALKAQVRPKLTELGDALARDFTRQTGVPVYPHVAKHMRRTVNPPVETWVAFCFDKRGYKKYPHLAVVVGEGGAEARFVVKTEVPDRPAVAKKLKASRKTLLTAMGKKARNADDLEKGAQGAPVQDADAFLKESLARLEKNKTATFGVGLPLDPTAKNFEQQARKSLEKFLPLWTKLGGVP